MERLWMCRICLSDTTQLQSIVGTHLHEMFEALTSKALVTGDGRPSLVCELCCSRLEACFELRKQSLRSEDLFPLLLRLQATGQLRVTPKMPLSTEDGMQRTVHVVNKDIVKQEGAEGAAQLAALKYRNDTLSNSLKRTDQTLDKVEEQKRQTRSDIEDTPVEKSKTTETGDNMDIRLHNDEQNNSTSDHSDAHREMSENKIIADQSVNSSSSDKLRPWSCDTCQICFMNKNDFRRHILKHTGKKPYECNVCKKWFSRKSNLVRHMRIHTGEKPYECFVCKKCFTHQAAFHYHILTHTDRKPYECNVCKKSFYIKSSLNVHMRIHTSAKPYECSVCKKCYNYFSSLRYHKCTHTGEKP